MKILKKERPLKSKIIISSEVTSFSDYFNSSGIDKLDLKLLVPKSLSVIKKILVKKGYSEVRAKNYKFNQITFVSGNKEIHLFIFYRSENYQVFKVSLNPNKFNEDISFVQNEVCSCLDIDARDLLIQRIDFNFDFNIKYNELLKNIFIRHKSFICEYVSRDGEVESIRLGKKNAIKIYNRGKLLKIDEDLSRIEFMFNDFQRVYTLAEFNQLLNWIFKENFFDKVCFFESESPFSVGVDLLDKDFKKLVQLMSIYEVYGFTQARKIFNRNNNFNRDYKRFFKQKFSSFKLKDYFLREAYYEQPKFS